MERQHGLHTARRYRSAARTRAEVAAHRCDPRWNDRRTPLRAARPRATLLDLALIIETDASGFRTGVDLQAERKAARGDAPVYMYRFEWYSPAGGGRLRAMHCMDIPFVFDND